MKPVQRIVVAAAALSISVAAPSDHAVESVLTATDAFPAFASMSPAAAPSLTSQGLPKAPTGHRQPNTRNVPASVLNREDMIDRSEIEFDKKLQICRRC